jgi:hypothetical protein
MQVKNVLFKRNGLKPLGLDQILVSSTPCYQGIVCNVLYFSGLEK